MKNVHLIDRNIISYLSGRPLVSFLLSRVSSWENEIGNELLSLIWVARYVRNFDGLPIWIWSGARAQSQPVRQQDKDLLLISLIMSTSCPLHGGYINEILSLNILISVTGNVYSNWNMHSWKHTLPKFEIKENDNYILDDCIAAWEAHGVSGQTISPPSAFKWDRQIS